MLWLTAPTLRQGATVTSARDGLTDAGPIVYGTRPVGMNPSVPWNGGREFNIRGRTNLPKREVGRPLFLAPKREVNCNMAGTAAVFIDGGYLDKVLEFDHPGKKINYERLVIELAEPDEVLRTYYYHCLPYKSSIPTADERKRYAAMHRFTTALKHLRRFEVRLGRLVYRGTDERGRPIFMQKRVDTMIGVDMALLAGKGKITNAVVLSGDSDMVPAIEAVKREGVLVTLWHGSYTGQSSPSRELVEICDERHEITTALIDKIDRG